LAGMAGWLILNWTIANHSHDPLVFKFEKTTLLGAYTLDMSFQGVSNSVLFGIWRRRQTSRSFLLQVCIAKDTLGNFRTVATRLNTVSEIKV
jgi:hypothetical protein